MPERKLHSGTVLSFELKKKAISASWKSPNKIENHISGFSFRHYIGKKSTVIGNRRNIFHLSELLYAMSKPELFIIESLELNDEKKGYFEGKILSDMLNLSEKKCIYYYIRTRTELIEILDEFYMTDYRYLHLSCHASRRKMATTFDSISFSDLGELLRDIGEDRRIFLSACSMSNKSLADAVIPQSRCYSILGPSTPVHFDDAAVFWTSFYHLMFKYNSRAMARRMILKNAEKVARMLGIRLNYFGRHSKKSVRHISIPRDSGMMGV